MTETAPTHPQPELRRDPITGDWVILAAGRGLRPHAPAPAGGRLQPPDDCPFCPGRETLTPPEICAIREGGGRDCSGWSVRTMPNKFPILVSDAPHAGAERASSPDRRPATGSSEVIVDSPVHGKAPWEVGPGQVLEMLMMYRDRFVDLKAAGRTSYVHIIRNHGAAAASSLEHPHSQLFGLPFIPPVIDAELNGFASAHPGEAGCILCDIVAETEEQADRMVMATDGFVVFSPFAARLPYETWIVPRRHQPRFEDCDLLEEMSQVMTEVLLRFRDRLDDPPLNYWLHSYPLHGESRPYHWHLEILPRLTVPGGLELGADVWVNIVAPEEAAALLR